MAPTPLLSVLSGSPVRRAVMRRPLFVITLAVLLVVRVSLGAADDILYARFGDYLESLRIKARIPGMAAAIVGRTDIQWERAFGYQNLERLIPTHPDTPFHLDGLTQVVTAALVLRCVEEGRLTLDATIAEFKPRSDEPSATIRQLLSHTSGSSADPVFVYRPERLKALASAIRTCTGNS